MVRLKQEGFLRTKSEKEGLATSFHECVLATGEVSRIIFVGSIYHSLSGWNIAEHSFSFFNFNFDTGED